MIKRRGRKRKNLDIGTLIGLNYVGSERLSAYGSGGGGSNYLGYSSPPFSTPYAPYTLLERTIIKLSNGFSLTTDGTDIVIEDFGRTIFTFNIDGVYRFASISMIYDLDKAHRLIIEGEETL